MLTPDGITTPLAAWYSKTAATTERRRRDDGIAAKYLPLIGAGLWRSPVRSALTAICILVAFVLLELLEGGDTITLNSATLETDRSPYWTS